MARCTIFMQCYHWLGLIRFTFHFPMFPTDLHLGPFSVSHRLCLFFICVRRLFFGCLVCPNIRMSVRETKRDSRRVCISQMATIWTQDRASFGSYFRKHPMMGCVARNTPCFRYFLFYFSSAEGTNIEYIAYSTSARRVALCTQLELLKNKSSLYSRGEWQENGMGERRKTKNQGFSSRVSYSVVSI